jgi:hypothetical protein
MATESALENLMVADTPLTPGPVKTKKIVGILGSLTSSVILEGITNGVTSTSSGRKTPRTTILPITGKTLTIQDSLTGRHSSETFTINTL